MAANFFVPTLSLFEEAVDVIVGTTVVADGATMSCFNIEAPKKLSAFEPDEAAETGLVAETPTFPP